MLLAVIPHRFLTPKAQKLLWYLLGWLATDDTEINVFLGCRVLVKFLEPGFGRPKIPAVRIFVLNLEF